MMPETPETNSKTFDFKYPFPVRGGATVSNLTARRPKVRDLRKFAKAAPDDSIGAIQDMLADLCEVPKETIAEIDIVDFKKMRVWLEDFLYATEDE